MATAASLDDFNALLAASRQQQEPQRLLFVFARRELGQHATNAQKESFERGVGGHLQPCLCVDKMPDEIASFARLAAESEQTGQHWDIVFVGGLEGRGGIAPNSDEADQPLRFMVNAIHDGRVGEFAAFDREGHAIRFV
ncbi:MAG: ribonucleotide reductase subunit alpha [Xanthomonadales bacterium]|nr:ribonucleotide reductase subunit alpha [Xanthomonadales bacterium]ODU94684.1 MAG: ribonucleotide reductase subunit alpha [Rhodanobacter sp. SCN 66-43]OJY85265.1 MAG: ribonucleotide reductase subunit alpha [Xanthomonadales bacterium 66-474]